MRGREVPACSDHSMTKRFSILIRSPHTEDPRCTCKAAWHCTLQGTSRIERSSLAPCQLKGIHFATFFLDPLFMARRSEVSGLRMTSSCGQRLARSAMMAGDAGIEIWKSAEFKHPHLRIWFSMWSCRRSFQPTLRGQESKKAVRSPGPYCSPSRNPPRL